jgi:TolB-like protein/Tfp pilus assembly protein PilF
MEEAGYRFGPFVFDPKRRILLKNGLPLPLGQKSLIILDTLLGAQGRVVSKTALMDAAWNGEAVEESNLSVQVAALRKTLGLSRQGVEWIATVQRVGYQFVNPDEMLTPALEPGQAEPPPPFDSDIPSIAVLAFVNMSGEREQDYFADGIAEEIITALSRFRDLFVIARNSSFVYKGRNVDVRQIGRELGVTYVLEGSVRKSASRVRITSQLVKAETSTHIWADRFDGELDDIFSLQDSVTARVVGAIAPKIERAEIERSRRKPTANLAAYDYYLRGWAALHLWNHEGNDEALEHFRRARELDPGFAAAYGVAARCYVQRKTMRGLQDYAAEHAEAIRLARRAVELGQDDAVALCTAAFALFDFAHDFDIADSLMERSLQLNPNLAMTWIFAGWGKVHCGEAAVAIERFKRALTLSPQDPQILSMYAGLACAYFVAGNYEEALSWAVKADRERPNIALLHCTFAACYGLTGRLEEAVQAVARLRHFAPDLRVSNSDDVLVFKRATDTERWRKGLTLAGLAE